MHFYLICEIHYFCHSLHSEPGRKSGCRQSVSSCWCPGVMEEYGMDGQEEQTCLRHTSDHVIPWGTLSPDFACMVLRCSKTSQGGSHFCLSLLFSSPGLCTCQGLSHRLLWGLPRHPRAPQLWVWLEGCHPLGSHRTLGSGTTAFGLVTQLPVLLRSLLQPRSVQAGSQDGLA